jgi:hypothetical protein
MCVCPQFRTAAAVSFSCNKNSLRSVEDYTLDSWLLEQGAGITAHCDMCVSETLKGL